MARAAGRSLFLGLLWAAGLGWLPGVSGRALAQADPPPRVLEVHFTPTARAQIALWIESADGRYLATVRLTDAVARRGIGNRPGATQMNSGFRWPYGRREGVLPVWAHRRAAAPGAEAFPRVVYQNRTSEGWASRSSSDFSRDDYYCLSFDASRSRRDALDAVTCASVFNSDKGRYLTEQDVAEGYAEPWEDAPAMGRMRPLPLQSLYPPRRDVRRCTSPGCYDHPDVDRFQLDALRVMPELDAVSMATPAGEEPQVVRFQVPADWPDGDYVLWAEVSVEGDYDTQFGPDRYPTPTTPDGKWDHWAMTYGYPYRGQPSVVYRLPFALGPAGGTFSAWEVAGRGALHGEDGDLRPASDLTDDPMGAPGSGVDRLRFDEAGRRLWVVVPPVGVCDQPTPPPECAMACTPGSCPEGFLCDDGGRCVGACDLSVQVPAVEAFEVAPLEDEKRSHRYARFRFTVPEVRRGIGELQVRYTALEDIVDEASFLRAQEARVATLEGERLQLPTDVAPGDVIESEFGELVPETEYSVAVRIVDRCGQAGPITSARVRTTAVAYTTVTPCFVATATYGSPMAAQVQRLRRFRDRLLMPTAPGRALVRLYYRYGPYLARFVAPRPWARRVSRTLLRPVVAAAEWLLGWTGAAAPRREGVR